jgi:RHH-type rel operon transcriptional repressor/antitoxin RelB
MSKVLNVRIEEDLSDRLDLLAEKTKRSKSFYIKEILSQHLAEYEDAYLALDRLNNRNAKYYSTEDAEKILDL